MKGKIGLAIFRSKSLNLALNLCMFKFKEVVALFKFNTLKILGVVVVVLLDPYQRMGAWKNSMEIQQLGHAPRSGPEVKNGRSAAEDGMPERLECGTVKEEVS